MDARFEELLEGNTAEIRTLAHATRERILASCPGADETVYLGWGSVAYSHPGKAGATVTGLSPYKKHVNLYFYQGTELPDPAGLLQGTGKQMRHAKVKAVADLQRPEIGALLAAAWAKGQVRTEAGSALLDKVRELCLALPEVTESLNHGHPTFKAGTKSFVTFGSYLGLALRVGTDLQETLLAEDPRFFMTPYMGPSGWISLKLDADPELALAGELIVHGYRMVANKRQLQALEALRR